LARQLLTSSIFLCSKSVQLLLLLRTDQNFEHTPFKTLSNQFINHCLTFLPLCATKAFISPSEILTNTEKYTNTDKYTAIY